MLQEREPVIVDDSKSVYKTDKTEKMSGSSRYLKKLPQLSTVIDQHSSEVSMTEEDEELAN